MILKVKDLMAELAKIDPEADVIAVYWSYGDELPGEQEHDITEVIVATDRLKPTVLLR